MGGLCKSNSSGLSRHTIHTSNPSTFNPSTASGTTVRKIIQSFEEMGILEKDYYGGRRLSQKGRKSLDSVAIQIFQEKGRKNKK